MHSINDSGTFKKPISLVTIPQEHLILKDRVACSYKYKIGIFSRRSKLKSRQVGISECGKVIVYEEENRGFVVDIAKAVFLTTNNDYYRTEKCSVPRCQIRLKMTYGTLDLYILGQKIAKWRENVLAVYERRVTGINQEAVNDEPYVPIPEEEQEVEASELQITEMDSTIASATTEVDAQSESSDRFNCTLRDVNTALEEHSSECEPSTPRTSSFHCIKTECDYVFSTAKSPAVSNTVIEEVADTNVPGDDSSNSGLFTNMETTIEELPGPVGYKKVSELCEMHEKLITETEGGTIRLKNAQRSPIGRITRIPRAPPMNHAGVLS